MPGGNSRCPKILWQISLCQYLPFVFVPILTHPPNQYVNNYRVAPETWFRLIPKYKTKVGIFSFLLVYFVFGSSRCVGIQEDEHILWGKKSGRKISIFHDENIFSKFWNRKNEIFSWKKHFFGTSKFSMKTYFRKIFRKIRKFGKFPEKYVFIENFDVPKENFFREKNILFSLDF